MNVKTALGWAQLATMLFASAAGSGLIHPSMTTLAWLAAILGGLSGAHSVVSGQQNDGQPKL